MSVRAAGAPSPPLLPIPSGCPPGGGSPAGQGPGGTHSSHFPRDRGLVPPARLCSLGPSELPRLPRTRRVRGPESPHVGVCVQCIHLLMPCSLRPKLDFRFPIKLDKGGRCV